MKSVWRIVLKDLKLELRGRDILVSVGTFSLVLVFLFGIAFDPTKTHLRPVFPGLIWLGFFFSAFLGIGRSFARERQQGTLEILLLTPLDRGSLFLAKLLVNLLTTVIINFLSLPVFSELLGVALPSVWGDLLLLVFLADVGFAAIGTVLSAIIETTRLREMLLPLLLFPLLIPVLLGAVQATTALYGHDSAHFVLWLKLLGVYDALFLVVPWLVFDYLLEV